LKLDVHHEGLLLEPGVVCGAHEIQYCQRFSSSMKKKLNLHQIFPAGESNPFLLATKYLHLACRIMIKVERGNHRDPQMLVMISAFANYV
jgi:hypothetical protein